MFNRTDISQQISARWSAANMDRATRREVVAIVISAIRVKPAPNVSVISLLATCIIMNMISLVQDQR